MKHASAGTGAALPPELDGWAAGQRWFAGKAHSPVLRSIGHWLVPTAETDVRITCHLVLDTASRYATLYQLPLTERRRPLAQAAAGLIGTSTGDDGAPAFVYDATHDPAYAAAILDFMRAGDSAADSSGTEPHGTGPLHAEPTGVTARGELLHPPQQGALAGLSVTTSRVLSGEQSNTSVIVDLADASGRPARPVIMKVFRVVANGSNPDVSVQSALARAGSRFVPEPIGAVSGCWSDPLSAERHTGHLVFAQEFLPGVEDAWRVALAAAEAGRDFQAPARALGVATAAVHRDLARAFPAVDSTPDVVNRLSAGMRERYRLAAREVPELAAYREAIGAIFDRAQAAPWPRLQRIHGDYHLGQVLDVPGRGWVLIDFEGEPLRPLAERTLPDIPLRDVAGMLRSFSYVGASVVMQDPAASDPATVDPTAIDRTAAWTTAARSAFLQGYLDDDGSALTGSAQGALQPLLAAFELDKAIYESVYETRNRPSWVSIPLSAVRWLVDEAEREWSTSL
jgi:maltokinase